VYQKYIFSKILQYADLFIITNDYDRKYFPKDFTNRIFAIYGGVNGEDILSARKKWDKQKKYDAVFCSRLHPQKGIDGLLDIWGKVVEEMPQVKLAVIGNGEKVYEEYLKKKAARLGIEKNIDWLGYVNGRDKYLIYLQSRIFLHGTIYDNNGMVAAEALCTGLPVIMYDLPQLKTVYTDGCTKVPIGDQQEYANTIIKALSDNQYYVSITLKELQKVSIETSWKWGNRIKLFQKFLRNK
jgi:glycosyltransferase involved in cell wall biosynthesis